MDEFPAGERSRARTIGLAPKKVKGWVHEVKVPLADGQRLRWETRHRGGDGEVEFNIHSHQGPKVTYHAKSSEPRASGTFAAPWPGDFYLMWENTTDRTVDVSYAVERTGGLQKG